MVLVLLFFYQFLSILLFFNNIKTLIIIIIEPVALDFPLFPLNTRVVLLLLLEWFIVIELFRSEVEIIEYIEMIIIINKRHIDIVLLLLGEHVGELFIVFAALILTGLYYECVVVYVYIVEVLLHLT